MRVLAYLDAVGAQVTLKYVHQTTGESCVSADVVNAKILRDGTCEEAYALGHHVEHAIIHLWDKLRGLMTVNNKRELLIIYNEDGETKTAWYWNGHTLAMHGTNPIDQPWY